MITIITNCPDEEKARKKYESFPLRTSCTACGRASRGRRLGFRSEKPIKDTGGRLMRSSSSSSG